MSQKLMQCPECLTRYSSGTLVQVRRIEETRPIIFIVPAVVSGLPIAEILETYIACTKCDFMGSVQEVIDLIKKPTLPRYSAYAVIESGPSNLHILRGAVVVDGKRVWENISTFQAEELAFAMLYRISGIVGKPGEHYYPVEVK